LVPSIGWIRDRYFEPVKTSLGSGVFEAARAEGRAMPIGHAIALARQQAFLLRSLEFYTGQRSLDLRRAAHRSAVLGYQKSRESRRRQSSFRTFTPTSIAAVVSKLPERNVPRRWKKWKSAELFLTR